MALERNQIAKEEAIKVPLELADNFEVLLGKLKETIKTLGAVNAAFSKNPGLKESRENIQKLAKAQTDLAKTETELVKQHKLLSDAAIKEEKAAQERLKTAQQEQRAAQLRIKTEVEAQKVIQAKARTQQQAAKEADRFAREEERAAKAAEKLRIAEEKAAQPLARLNKLRNEAQLRLKNLIAAEELHGRATKQSTAQIQKAQLEFNKLDKAYVRVQRSARQFNDNVGNYPQLFGSATQALKGFVGAFGLIGGVQLFARVVTDAFKRVRDFDKEVVNLAAIAGTTRPNIKSLEKEIIRVAGTSIKTANEVAGLATELIKLGSSTDEAEKLIKPVNDFSIALRAGSEESAAFLKGVLNAFGVGAESAGRFADVLSNAANRSALDFQGLNDSLGYVAPTARALNIPIERLAAQIGTLADNNITASRAGRLLNTSFARLVSQGKSLEGALDEIRNSTDKVKTATDLFGAESFNIGLILASNEEKVNDLTKAFENSEGSLKRLTDEQLKSLDAQLKILDSSWEAFILSVENGEGVLGKAFLGVVKGLSALLDGITNSGNEFDLFFNGLTKSSDETIDLLLRTGSVYEKAIGRYRKGSITLTKEVEGQTKSIQSLLETVVGGVSDNEIFANLRFFEKEFIKVLVRSGVELDKASVLAVRWGQTFKANFKEVAETIKEETPDAVDAMQSFALSLDGMNRKSLDELIKKLEQTKASAQVAFDKTGAEGLKTEMEDLGDKITVVNNKIKSLIDTEEQITNIEEAIKQKEIEIENRVRLEQKGIDLISASTTEASKERLRIENESSNELFALREKALLDQLNIQNLTLEQEKKINEQLISLRTEREIQVEGLIRKGVEVEIQAANDLASEKETVLQNEIKNLQNQFSRGEITRNQYNQRILDLEKTHSDELYDVQANALLDILSLEELTAEDRADALKKLHDLRIKYAEEGFNREAQLDDERKKLNQAYTDFVIDNVSTISNHVINAQKTRLENEIESTRNIYEVQFEALENQISKEEEGSQRRQLLEERLIKKKEEFAKREAQIRQRQAKLQRSQALIEIAINTARGVMQAYANVNPLVVAPLVALTIATGAVQAALVASQPLPQYAEGTEDSAKDFIAGEKGSEIVKEKSGKTHITKGATLFKNKPHSIVYNHDDTVRILNNSMLEGLRVNDRMPTYSDKELINRVDKGFKTLTKTIKSKPANIIQGRIVGGQINGTRLRKINKYRGL